MQSRIASHYAALVSLCLVVGTTVADQIKSPKSMAARKTIQVTKNVYVIQGYNSLPNEQNEGFNNNPGFIVTSAGVVIVDPGSSVHIGFELLQRIRKVTKKPVIAVFNTHVHGDHWLGNHAIKRAYPKVKLYAHSYTVDTLKTGVAQEWVDRFYKMTKGKIGGTKPVPATLKLNGGEVLTFGDTRINIHNKGRAHTSGDLMIEVPSAKTIFMGDIASNTHISTALPRQSSSQGLIRSIKFMIATNNKHYIPGHGKIGGPEIARQQMEFWQKLRKLVKQFMAQGLTDYEMKPKIISAMKQYRHWDHFDEIGRVINHVYLELEAENISISKQDDS